MVIKPLVDALFAYLKSNERKVSTAKLKQAVTYALNQEKYLRVFLEDGEVPMDNNASERAIRGFCIGKKNWEMIDTINGATSSAIIYSIAETAKANNLKPYEYFEYLLTQILAHMDDIDRSFLEDWKIFFRGHQSCQNTSENKKTVVNGLLKVKVHGVERLLINYLLTMIINIILIVSKILYKVNWYSLPDVNKKLYHKIIPSPYSTISNTTLYYILFIQY